MANTSATGGYLAPTTAPLDDVALRRFMHGVIAGVTGLTSDKVRPAWQPNPPVRPGIDVNWSAYAIINQTPEAGTAYQQTRDDGGYNLKRHESFDVLVSMYGPLCQAYAGLLRDGLEISQNRELLYLASMAYVGASATTHVPELVNDRWFDRADITLTFRREIVREYHVLNFLSANGLIYTETITPPIPWQVAPEA